MDDPLPERKAVLPLVTATELANMLRCSRQTIFNLARTGKIETAVSLGGLRRFYVPDSLLSLYKGGEEQ